MFTSSARLISFEIRVITKEISQAEPEYMIYCPINTLIRVCESLVVLIPEVLKETQM